MSIKDTPYFVNVLLHSAADLHLDEELLRAVAAVDMRALLINARIAAGDHFTKSLTSAMVAEARPADLALLARLEGYAAGSDLNRADVVGACPAHLVMECFVKVEAIRSMDFERFDSQMARLMACLGRSYVGDDAIGGMEPAQYWSMMVSCCQSFDGDDGEELFVSDLQPEHWSAWLHHAVTKGMGPESLVFRESDQPTTTETFRQAILDCAGHVCASMFDAIVIERSMEARLRSAMASSPPTPRRKSTPL